MRYMLGSLPLEAQEYISSKGMKPRYNFWAKMATWTAEEAIALALDIDPGMMKTDIPRNMVWPIGVPLREMKQLVHRAIGAYEIYDPTRPAKFIAWAKAHDIDFPQELEKLLPESEPKKEQPIEQPREKLLGTRERETLLKLIIGLAVAGYKYNPKAAKNSAVSEIASDLEKLGIAMSDDTVRKWLNEAAEFLPAEPEKT